MAGLAILLLVESATASFALAGLAVAAFGAGSAVGGVLQARWIDRTRQTTALVACGLAHPLALALLVPAARLEAPPVLLALAAPSGVMLVVAAASGLGALGLAATGASRAWRRRPGAARPTGSRIAGPLSSPAIRLTLAAAVLFGIGDGGLQVAVAGFAVRHGSPRLAGLLLTAMSVGSVAAGLVYGTRSWRGSWPARFAALNWLLGAALALAALALAADASPLAVAVALLLAGLAVAPIATESSLLIDAAAPPGTVTEAFAWLVTGVVAGGAAGSALAGQLLERLGAGPAMLLAAVAPIAAGVATWLCRRAVRAESEPPP